MPSTWIFQANPAKYHIHQALANEREELWNCNQHAHKIHAGDRVLIWLSGARAGIYAQGRVLEGATERPDTLKGQDYWKDKRQGVEVRPRVKVKYETSFLDNPLLKVFLRWDPALEGLSVMTQPRGTNFVVRPEEWLALEIWLERLPDGL